MRVARFARPSRSARAPARPPASSPATASPSRPPTLTPPCCRELRRHVPDSVATREGAFEDLPLAPAYDLVFAAASLHWTTPEGRWTRVAGMLVPGGIFASFGGQRELADPDLRDRVEAVRSTYLDDDEVPSPDGTPADSPMQWPGTELTASAFFVDVRQSTIERRTTMAADDYVGHLSTVSAYLRCPSPFAVKLSTPSSRSCRPEWRWWVTSSSISLGCCALTLSM